MYQLLATVLSVLQMFLFNLSIPSIEVLRDLFYIWENWDFKLIENLFKSPIVRGKNLGQNFEPSIFQILSIYLFIFYTLLHAAL